MLCCKLRLPCRAIPSTVIKTSRSGKTASIADHAITAARLPPLSSPNFFDTASGNANHACACWRSSSRASTALTFIATAYPARALSDQLDFAVQRNGLEGYVAVVGPDPLIRPGEQRRGNDQVGAGQVAGHPDVPHGSDTQQRFNVWVVRLRLQRVPKEDEQIDLTFGDLGADLLVAAHRAREKAVHMQTELVLEHGAGRAGGVQDML